MWRGKHASDTFHDGKSWSLRHRAPRQGDAVMIPCYGSTFDGRACETMMPAATPTWQSEKFESLVIGQGTPLRSKLNVPMRMRREQFSHCGVGTPCAANWTVNQPFMHAFDFGGFS